jgi:flagellar biosynthesis protein FlhF
MRVKTFTADNTATAMGMVRDSMGNDAVIVSSYQLDDGLACIVAALEPANEDIPSAEPLPPEAGDDMASFLRHSLVSHGVPNLLAARLAKLGSTAEITTAVGALSHAFEHQLGFAPLEPFEEGMPPLMLIGPPGAGKTITAAKICARAHMAKQPVSPVTTDVKRAGGVEQLAAFTRILKLELQTAPDLDALQTLVRDNRELPERLIIDTAGSNPYDDHDMAMVARIIDAADGEVVLVLPAGGDAAEAADIACIYANAGATRMIVTRMDVVRRFGGIIAAANAARLPLADVSTSHRAIEGLAPITPGVLARLVMPKDDDSPLSMPITDTNEDDT